MHVLLSMDRSSQYAEPMVGRAVRSRALGAEGRVWSPPGLAELPARVGVPLVTMGVWR
jgi:hypothetical protein